jgi:hypothetical protein
MNIGECSNLLLVKFQGDVGEKGLILSSPYPRPKYNSEKITPADG